MITSSVSEISKFQPLFREPEFQVSVPNGASGLIVSPLHVRTSDGQVLLTWDDNSAQVECVQVAEQIVNGFLATARKAIAKFPTSSHAHTTLGVALLKSGDVNKAIEVLRSAITLNPSNTLPAMTLADALFKKGNLAEAEEIYLRVCSPRNQERASLALAAIALRRKEYDAAKQCLIAALATNAHSAQLHFMLGLVELNKGNIDRAIGSLRMATRLEVRRSAHHHSLGIAYAIKKNYAMAEREFRVSLSLSPRSVDSTHALAQILIDKGDADEAVHLLAPYLEAHANDHEARQLLARGYSEKGRHALARFHIQRILQASTGALSIDRKVGLLNLMAVSFMRDNMPEEAELALRRAIDLGPNTSPVPYQNLGRVYLHYLDQPESALRTLRIAKQIFTDCQTTRVLYAIALAASDEFGAAIRELLPFWKQDTAEESMYVCLGWLYEHEGDVSNAISVLSAGLNRFPHSLGIINNLAYTRLMCGDLGGARIVLSGVPKKAVQHVELVATFGLLRFWEGQERAGCELYERAELMARDEGRKDVVRKVKQKRHLELARLYIRRGDRIQAVVEVRQGLAIRDFPLSFRRELEQLKQELSIAERELKN